MEQYLVDTVSIGLWCGCVVLVISYLRLTQIQHIV